MKGLSFRHVIGIKNIQGGKKGRSGLGRQVLLLSQGILPVVPVELQVVHRLNPIWEFLDGVVVQVKLSQREQINGLRRKGGQLVAA